MEKLSKSFKAAYEETGHVIRVLLGIKRKYTGQVLTIPCAFTIHICGFGAAVVERTVLDNMAVRFYGNTNFGMQRISVKQSGWLPLSRQDGNGRN